MGNAKNLNVSQFTLGQEEKLYISLNVIDCSKTDSINYYVHDLDIR